MSFTVNDFGTNRQVIYDFLLLTNTNLPPILHRFGDTGAKVKIALFGYPLAFTPADRSVCTGMISVKLYFDVSGWLRYKMAKKH